METKLGQSFQALRSEKQKRTTLVVSQLLDHRGAAILVQIRNSDVSLNPQPLKEIYSVRIKCWDLTHTCGFRL